MRPSVVKGPTVAMSRPTKASLARQSKIRSSILISSTTTTITNKLKSIQNHQQNKSENDPRTMGLTKRTGTISKNNTLFKRPKAVNKLAAIISSSSLDNSTADGETLKQVIVASLTENVKKLDLVESHNKENYLSESPKKPISLLNQYLAEHLHIEQIELPYVNSTLNDEDDEPIDPLYAMDYIVDIMNLLYTLEAKYPIQSSFLTNPSLAITTIANGSAIRSWKLTAKHRIVVVGWIIQLFYARFQLTQDSMHLCIGLLDRFLQHCVTSNGFITQKNLQLIAVATFLIAAKVEETHHPPVDELVYVTDHTYTSDQVKNMEKKILHELRFELNRPTSLQFLRRFSFISSGSDEQHAIGKFIIDMALLDISCIDLSPSLVAASATYIARYILNQKATAFEQCWPCDLQIRSPYKTLHSLSNGVRALAQCINAYLTGNSSKEYEIIVKRYENEQLLKASLYCVEQRTLIHKLANEPLVN
ncbi:unnamed protein product [Rotaria magnacalcarata]|uniref:Uncharacterized protein n=4 Tax=Rotaria magnacalcarata TaxID=392030 RepID=A0A816NEK0_9BILA|nr:unnamed protein product [Rotaria magnacalcarata]CAF1667113.1 unnamed protein product [Rotaria magnacalcarata]CAF2023122.1 unnamed protein product [Rotaria magnacalcarata]CAF2083396.1 unnamed protein product [Rotaria magnacalcarata]CAF2094052.1 unnamed protein product [Rotaria magnacalcarata]